MGEKAPLVRIPPPGPRARKIIEEDHIYLATSTKSAPVAVVRGEGVTVEDADGNTYLDFTSGVGVLNVGHAHPRVVEAIRTQAGKFTHYAGTDFYYSVQVELAKRLTALVPGGSPKKVFFTNSGTESNEAAIKLVRWSTRRGRIIASMGAFHGRTMGSLSLTASRVVHRSRYFPMMPGVTHIPFAHCYRCPYRLSYPECDLWCARILDEVYLETHIPPDEVGCAFIEPIQGEGGYIIPPEGYFACLKRILDKHGILLVDDEVQAGIGRTGRWFAIGHFGVVPDVVTTAKGLGSGMPIGAAVFRSELDWGVSGSHSNTYGGNPMACAAALATLDIIEKEHLLENAVRTGEHLLARLKEVQASSRSVDDARGLGLMCAVDVVSDREHRSPEPDLRDRLLEECLRNGLILLGCGRSAIRFIPPLVITEEEIDTAMDILERAVRKVEG